jgi:hypothetical protein
MGYVQADRVQETTISAGTGPVTLAGAVSGFRRFQDVMSVGDTCFYLIIDPATSAWETGVGTLSSTTVLDRTSRFESSTGAAISFAAGSKFVMMTQPAKASVTGFGSEGDWTTLAGEDIESYRASDTPIAAPAYIPYRSRGTPSARTAVVNADALAYLLYLSGYDGTDWVQGAQILAYVDGTVAAGKVPTALQFMLMDDTGSLWYPIHVRGTQDVVVDGIWKNLWANGIFIDGSWNAYGGTLSYPTVAALRENYSVSGTGATGTIHLETLDRTAKILTANGTANFTINMRGNSSYTLDQTLSVGDAVSFRLLAPMGTTAYYASSITVDGGAATVKWAGGSAPAGGVPSALNIYDFQVIKTAAATFTVLGQMGAMT